MTYVKGGGRIRLMNYPASREEKIRASLLLARQQHEVQELATAAGCSRQYLTGFISGGTLGDTYQNNLESWLKSEGFWIWDRASSATQERWEHIASELES